MHIYERILCLNDNYVRMRTKVGCNGYRFDKETTHLHTSTTHDRVCAKMIANLQGRTSVAI
jgi:hypothetical protein